FGKRRCDMARNGYLILDSDLHMMEPDDLWARYLEGPHRANLPKFFGGQQRTLTVNSEDKGNADTIIGMEVAGLAIPAHGKAAGGEARRCVRELGAVAISGTPNPVNGQHLHDEACDPLWSALEELDVPIGFHPTGNTSLKDDAGRRYVGHANFQPIAHAIRNPVELMGAIASMRAGGILERHPRLRCAFLAGTARWPSWWLWRLDDQWEKFGPGCEHQLSMPPSEYFKRQCYIALDVDEEPAVDVVEKMGADYFVVSADYPHSDGAFPEALEQLFKLPLRDEVRRKI